ncbi:MAG: hypothetical protein K6G84_09435, partial [Lachnospiraceae bacterium]|nr:hypothetical protein [Lachnospiraceae bacterium]
MSGIFGRNRNKRLQEKEIHLILLKERKNFSDICSENITYLIEYSEGEYIIYLDSDGDLDWEFTDDYIETVGCEQFSKNIAEITLIQKHPAIRAFETNQRKDILILLGVWLANCHDQESCSAVHRTALEQLRVLEIETTRKWIIEYEIVIIIIALVMLIIQNHFLFFMRDVMKCCCIGAIGNVLSVLLNTGKINCSCSTGRFSILFECISKCIIGVISSVIIYFAINSKILLYLDNVVDNIYLMDLFCMSGGFCERF